MKKRSHATVPLWDVVNSVYKNAFEGLDFGTNSLCFDRHVGWWDKSDDGFGLVYRHEVPGANKENSKLTVSGRKIRFVYDHRGNHGQVDVTIPDGEEIEKIEGSLADGILTVKIMFKMAVNGEEREIALG